MKVIVEQGDLLDALMALIKDADTDQAAEILRKLVKESEPVGVLVKESQPVIVYTPPNGQPITHTPAAAEPTESPLSLRLEELRDQHGPVWLVYPKEAVGAGQTLKNGDGRMVEMLEPAELPDHTGKVKPGGWFGKEVLVEG